MLLVLLGACARPVGDFGRAAPDVLHDRIMPAAGAMRARASGEPVSSFNRTDEEVDMANRLWRFETSGRIGDWFMDVAAEMQRTRLAVSGGSFAIDRYYGWLHGSAYRSSAVRYATVADDLEADLATLPDAFASICKVEAIDRQRQVIFGNLQSAAGSQRHVVARLAENDNQVGSFVAALRYRQQSYDYALDHLLLETPDPAARGVNERLAVFDRNVHRAEQGDFCDAGERPHAGNPQPAPAVPSRFIRGNPPAAVGSTPAKGS